MSQREKKIQFFITLSQGVLGNIQKDLEEGKLDKEKAKTKLSDLVEIANSIRLEMEGI